MFFLTAALLILMIFLTYFYTGKIRRRAYLNSKIPGPTPLPIIGNTLSFIVSQADLWKIVHQMNDDYYPIYKISTYMWTVINLRHPDDAEALLTSTRHIAKSALYDFIHPWFKTGLLTSTGTKWHHRRKILTPAFHFNVLREFASIFDEEGRRMVRDLKNEKGDGTHDLLPLTTKYTLNTICETAMGTSFEGNSTFYQKYRKAVYALGEYMLHRLLRPWIHADFLFSISPTGRKQKKALEIVHSFSSNIIRERQQYHEETAKEKGNVISSEKSRPSEGSRSSEESIPSKKRLAMLDLLIDAMKEGRIDEPGIREEVDTFIFEGHDTSAMGMSFALLLLAEHKEIQQKAREEIDSVLASSDGIMGITEIQKLTYLDRCIKESLRLYPSVPMISRSIEEDLKLKNYIIPGGTIAHIHIYDLHRDPNFWPDPHKFDPDRFLPENCVDRHPFAYVPFSAGQRNCIGQKFAMLELKAFIGHLLHNFHLEPIDLASEVKLLPDLVLRPTHPVRIKFVPRAG